MAVEEEGLRVFQSVRIKIGEDRGDLGSSPDPCSCLAAQTARFSVALRGRRDLHRGRLFVCVSARGCLRVSVCAGPLLDRSGSRAPEFTCTSTRGSVWVFPL